MKKNPLKQLVTFGQSIWFDNIARGLLTSGALSRFIEELSVTKLTSSTTTFYKAIKDTCLYDDAIHHKSAAGKSGEMLSFELALEDLIQAADLLRPIHDATNGVDGWVSLEVSPSLAEDTAAIIKATVELHGRAQRPNLFIKIPGTREVIPAIEEPMTSLFISRWDVAVKDRVPVQLRNRLGIAADKRTFKASH